MPKTTLLVISPPGHYALRKLEALRDLADIAISNDQTELEVFAPAAEVILYTGLSADSVDLAQVWRYARSVRWIHSLATGVEKILFPAMIDSKVPLTNARGAFKRSLAEFAMLGVLFHTKKVRRLVDNQRAHKW